MHGKKRIVFQLLVKEKNTTLVPHITCVLPLLKRDDFESALYMLAELGVNSVQLVTKDKSVRSWGDKERERVEQILLETNIDDMNPELYAYAEEKLFEAGALDVFKTPIIMKKGRPAVLLSVLTDAEAEEAVTRTLFRETTSIGLRRSLVGKVMLQREIVTLQTPLGQVRVKKVFLDSELVGAKPEYEDVRRIALEQNMPIAQVYREIEKSM
ncbi:MAG: nickel insertion protein [Eubacteriales bacterium]